LKGNYIIGESEGRKSCLEQASVAVHSEIPVLLTGEMGTGKEWFAKTIHLNSDRCEKNFVIVDCSAMNPPIQQALVTAIEQQVFVPVGGLHTETSDFRVVASNSGNSDRGPGCFQKDFFFRFEGGLHPSSQPGAAAGGYHRHCHLLYGQVL